MQREDENKFMKEWEFKIEEASERGPWSWSPEFLTFIS